MTLYLKYRPQKLAELDNEEIRLRLNRVLASTYLPHALLFTGPKGTGKTSAARIVAKVLNCEKNIQNLKKKIKDKKGPSVDGQQGLVNVEPCNSCETCLAIKEGRHLDIIEIDAASNRGIDEIRELREKIKLAPLSARFKIYIIDEVHMLTNEAFNALLKTLEEPPAHAVFILATTEPEKLPATIISRCIKFNFHRANISEIIHCLSRIVVGEKQSIPEKLLHQIAVSSDGSFRDATKILEQAILEEALTEELLNKLLGRERETAQNLLTLMSKKNTKEVLRLIVQMSTSGMSFRFLVEDILQLLHNLLLAQNGVSGEKVPEDLLNTLTRNETTALIKLFSRVFIELKSTSFPYLPLEVAVVEWCEKEV